MDNIERLNTLCPVCDGPVSFEADRLGEWVHCPHCQELIALGSVEPLQAAGNVTSETTARAHGARNVLRLLACAGALLVLLAGCVFLYRTVAAVQPEPKFKEKVMAAKANMTPPVPQPVSLPAPPPALAPPPANQDDAEAELARQRQEQLNQQQIIAQMRRANDLAEANARWQRWNEMESRTMMDSQPLDVVQPVEITEPVQAFPEIEIIQPQIWVYGGGARTGSPILRNYPIPVGQRGRGYTTYLGNAAYPAPRGN